jgi:hypothetical protein
MRIPANVAVRIVEQEEHPVVHDRPPIVPPY